MPRRGLGRESQLEAMDTEHLDVTVLFPSRGLFVLAIDSVNVLGPTDGLEPEFASAIARAYNDWLHDFCEADPKRMYGAAMVAPHDVDGGGRRAATLRRGVRLQGRVPHPGPREPPTRGTTRRTTRCGPSASA